jgi:predicted Zn-dependent protease
MFLRRGMAMARDDWFRQTSWTAQDAVEFQARLKRSRGDVSKAQYLRIQAIHLAGVGLHDAALKLTDQLLKNHPVPSQLASTYLLRAESYAAVGKDAEAADSFRSSLAAQDHYPNMRTCVALSFAWFIVLKGKVELYREVEPLLQRYEKEVGLAFPVQRFKCAVVRALLASEEGRPTQARSFADEARAMAGEQDSGLRYHAKLGLVDDVPPEVAKRLAAIDSGV